MNLARYQLIIAIAAILLSSCTSQENTLITGIGWVTFDLSVDETPGAEANDPFALTMSMDGSAYTHTWYSIDEMQPFENLYVGNYSAYAVSGIEGAEGYRCPCYKAATTFRIDENQRTFVNLHATLTQALVDVKVDPVLSQAYPGSYVTMHTIGNGFLEVEAAENSPLLLSPGKLQAFVTLPIGEEQTVTLAPQLSASAQAAEKKQLEITLTDSGSLVFACDGKEETIELTDDLLNSPAPTIDAGGFTPDSPLVLVEGYPSDQPITMNINTPAGLRSIMLTSQLPSDISASLPEECDLLDETSKAIADGLELTITDQGKQASLNFSRLIEGLSVNARASAKFTIVAYDQLGRATAPMRLIVSITSVNIVEAWETPALIGEDIATIDMRLSTGNIEASDFTVYLLDQKGEIESQAPVIEEMVSKEEMLVRLKFKVPPGTHDVPVRVDYMGQPRVFVTVTRRVPEYQMIVDAFATHAVLMLKANDPTKTSALIKYATVTTNGKQTSVYSRDPEAGTLVVAGLQPSSTYTVEPVIIPDGFSVKATITTESAASVPEGDFEDFTDLIKYSKMPMGGTYSSTAFPIYSEQNYADFDIKWVKKHWTSVNDKTFSRSARNHNTWYMEPSAMLDFDIFASGGKSMRICSVGWSLDGEDIKPYAQEPNQYVPYNANVPEVAHRSAGKLFLGSYKFSAATLEENYTEGATFTSRPSALNGFYRYMPSADALDDCGTATIQLMGIDGGKEIEIASAQIELPPAPDFLSFNIPLTYEKPGIKATKLKIMFASSRHAGTIEEEDANVPVSAHVPNGRYIGGELWIDNLTFSY